MLGCWSACQGAQHLPDWHLRLECRAEAGAGGAKGTVTSLQSPGQGDESLRNREGRKRSLEPHGGAPTGGHGLGTEKEGRRGAGGREGRGGLRTTVLGAQSLCPAREWKLEGLFKNFCHCASAVTV